MTVRPSIRPARVPTALHAPEPVRWHRPLLVVAAMMALLTIVALILRFVDPREVTALDVWDKPLKFAISTVLYCVTWSWLIGQLTRFHRIARIAGTVIAAALAVELAIIVGAAVIGTTSHFNVSSPVAGAFWGAMGISITALWVATLVVGVLLFRNPLGDPARTTAIRSGAAISLLGLALAFLMTAPTASQLSDPQGIAGAHTVGIADGGPGIPVLGWSTAAGDLRIPHFIGMHALQLIPLALIALELLSRRVGVLRDVTVRARLVWTFATGYLAVVGLVTVQALRGQSIMQPDVATLAAGGAIVIAVLASTLTILVRGRVPSS